MVAAQIGIVQGRDGRARGVDLSRKAILKAIFAVLDGGTNGDDPVANVIDLRGTVLELELRGASAVIYVHLQDVPKPRKAVERRSAIERDSVRIRAADCVEVEYSLWLVDGGQIGSTSCKEKVGQK